MAKAMLDRIPCHGGPGRIQENPSPDGIRAKNNLPHIAQNRLSKIPALPQLTPHSGLAGKRRGYRQPGKKTRRQKNLKDYQALQVPFYKYQRSHIEHGRNSRHCGQDRDRQSSSGNATAKRGKDNHRRSNEE
ncbi:hypothetical protein FHR23_001517 [Stakelama sediminis]|uniref:Uncharacterized protein n=1 Tax=Stakelama sediminis TaxID=463200 RepID=A0A840YYJ5_9SPHN|nr:hypothetical protein [Stakelama sediminis]